MKRIVLGNQLVVPPLPAMCSVFQIVLTDFNRDFSSDGVSNTANSCTVACDIEQRCDTYVVSRALDNNVSSASVGQIFNLLLYIACSRIYCIGLRHIS